MSLEASRDENRYQNVSLLRFVLTLNIFLFHLFYVYATYDSESFVPLSAALSSFNFLSAFLYAKRDFTYPFDFYRKEGPKLLLPPLVAIVLVGILNFLVLGIAQGDLSLGGYFASFWSYTARHFHMAEFGAFWYPFVIVILYSLIPMLALSLKKKWMIPVFIFFAFAEFYVAGYEWQPICYTPFILGYYYGHHFKMQDLGAYPQRGYKDNKWLALAAFLGVFAIYFTFRHFLDHTFTSSFWFTVGRDFLTMASGVSFVPAFLRLTRGYVFVGGKLLRYSDRLSYSFFLMQIPFMTGALDIHQYGEELSVTVFYVFLTTLVSSYIVAMVSEHLRKKFFPPKKKKTLTPPPSSDCSI
jgi:peptidoglycan/LPS O-acetylase OafA/YrhL